MELPKLDIVIPVYNNSDVLEQSIVKQIEFYNKYMGNYDWNIIIANNMSTDSTLDLAKRLADKFDRVKYLDIPKKGRGNALNFVWSLSNADYMCYMDVDLATSLEALPALISNLQNGYDISVGSKYISGSVIERNILRYTISRSYNFINYFLFNARFTDAQCGFKAINNKVAKEVLPKIKDGNWFFDTELLVYSQRLGFKLKEVPVNWKELGMAKKSGVKMMNTINEFIFKMWELKFRK